MSPSNEATPFKVKIFSSDQPNAAVAYRAKITIFNSQGKECGSGRGTVTLDLPPGLYTARIEYLGAMREEVVIHRDSTDQTVQLPKRNSAMPMANTSHNHEFLQMAAIDFSKKSTFDQAGVNTSLPRLMIMMRKTGDDKGNQENLAPEAVLLDEEGKVVSDFSADKTSTQDPKTYLVYSALLKPGNYILSVNCGSRMEMLPISLFKTWDTFAFIPYQKGLRLSATSLKITEHNSGYDPEDWLSAEIDAALLGLGSRLDLLDPDVQNSALVGKFDHPLIGLIGAHSHFRGTKRKERLESQVLYNLWNLLPGSIDVIALLLMSLGHDEDGIPSSIIELDRKAEEAFGSKISHLLPLSFPPMLNSSLDAISRATKELPTLIKDDSWIEAAGNSTYGSNLWATWDQQGTIWTSPQAGIFEQTEASQPSTQKLYPAVKKAIAAVAQRKASEIIANAEIDQLFDRTESTLESVINIMDLDVSDFRLNPLSTVSSPVKTVRDLVKQVQQEAKPIYDDASPDQPVRQTANSKFSPSFELDDWLVDLVHEKIEDEKLDIGQFAKIYAVSRNTIAKALKQDRPPKDASSS